MLLYIPCIVTVKCNYQNFMAVVLIAIFSFISYYLLNNVLTQVAVQDQIIGLQIIKILLGISVVAIATNIFFIKQNCFLCAQIRNHQSLEQDLCQQRDLTCYQVLEIAIRSCDLRKKSRKEVIVYQL